jgi:hypothetical protein
MIVNDAYHDPRFNKMVERYSHALEYFQSLSSSSPSQRRSSRNGAKEQPCRSGKRRVLVGREIERMAEAKWCQSMSRSRDLDHSA